MEYKNGIKLKHIEKIKAEILKGLIVRGNTAEKLKSLIKSFKADIYWKAIVLGRTRFACFRLWATRAFTLVLVLAILIHFKALFDYTFRPKFLNSSLPPQSKYYNYKP